MTQLQRRALARTGLDAADVHRIYADHIPTVDGQQLYQLICDLCESHERLRSELQGAEQLLAEAEAEVLLLQAEGEKLRAAIGKVQLNDEPIDSKNNDKPTA